MSDVQIPTKRLFSRATLSAAVATIGVISGILGVYSGFFYDKKPALNIAVLSNAPVVDVKEDVAELTLSFKGEKLRESKRTVSVIVLRVANIGNAPILPNYYDLDNDWGVELNGGEIVAVTFENASTTYLTGKLVDFSKKSLEPHRVALPRMILESEQGFTIRVLALHADSVQPSVTAFGKIATIAAPSVTTLPLESNRPAVSVAFGGTIAVQILRFAGYGLGFIVVLVMGVGAGVFLSTVFEKREKRRIALHCARLLEPEGATEDEELKAAIRLYREGGVKTLRQMNYYIQDPKRLKRYLDREEENAKKRASLVTEYEDRSVEGQLLKKYAQLEGDSFKISPTFIAKLHRVMEEAGIKDQSTEPSSRLEEVFIEGRPIGLMRRENDDS